MFRRISLCLLLSVISLSAFPVKRLMIELTNGAKVYYSFADYVPMIRFDKGTMRVTTQKFEFGRIAQFAVVDDTSSIDEFQAVPQVSPDGMVLTFLSQESVCVYDIYGVAQQVGVTVSGHVLQVSLSSLASGSYVVCCGNQSFTIYKR